MRPSSLRTEARALVGLALPAVAHSLLQTMVFLADRLMLGHHSETALASMQAAGPVLWTVQSVFSAFNAGTLAVVGRSVGADDPAAATSALRGSLAIAVALGLVVGGAGLAGLDPLLAFMLGGPRGEVTTAAHSYLSILFAAMPLVFVGSATTYALQASGDTRTPFAIAAFTNVLNVALNTLLIFGLAGFPRLGATGAAIANASALGVEAILGLAALSRTGVSVSLRSRGAHVDALAGARRVLAVSWSAFGERAIYHAGYLVFVRFINGLGATAMAAHQALLSIESVSFLSADGFAVAAGATVSRSLGAEDVPRARRAAWIAAGLCASIAALFALVLAALPGPLIALFRNDPAMAAQGVPALRVGALAQAPMAVAIVLAQSLRAAGATREAFAVALVGSFAVRVAATWFFVVVLRLGLVGVWLGSTTDWYVRALVCAWRWTRGRWSRAKV